MATADIQKIYLGLLGRPADAEGLAYWNEQIENGTLTLEQLRANIVNEQPEFAEGPGQMSRADFVAQLYVKMFGREPDEQAEYWLTGDGANVNLDQLVFAFTDGASEEDTAALNNRAAVAQRITDEGLALEDDVETLLEGVTNDPDTVTAAEQAVEDRVNGETEDAPSTGGGGGGGTPTYTLAEALALSSLPDDYNIRIQDDKEKFLSVDFTGESAFVNLSSAVTESERALDILKGALNLPKDNPLESTGDEKFDTLLQALFVYDVALNKETGALANPPANGTISVAEGLAAFYAQNIDQSIVKSGGDVVKTDLGTALGLFTLKDSTDAIFEIASNRAALESDVAAIIQAVDIVEPNDHLSVAQVQTLQSTVSGTQVTLNYKILDSLGNVFWYGSDENYDHAVVPQVVEAQDASSITLIESELDISSLKVVEGEWAAPTTLDLSQVSTIGNITVRVADLANDTWGNKTDLGDATTAITRKSDQTIKLPSLDKIGGNIALENMTIASTGGYSHSPVQNDVVDITSWNLQGESDLVDLITQISIEEGEGLTAETGGLNYVDLVISFDKDDDGTADFDLALANLVSKNVYNKMLAALDTVADTENTLGGEPLDSTLDLVEWLEASTDNIIEAGSFATTHGFADMTKQVVSTDAITAIVGLMVDEGNVVIQAPEVT
ncbi:DUF4214 domain-containing protein [Vreelandella venusta]|uniref:hypothetical protein n=1 Tax=Vreelandella venusta TaxID=44935 RepID=UPI00384AED78